MEKKDNLKDGLKLVPLTIYVSNNKKSVIKEMAKNAGINVTKLINLYYDYGRKSAGKKSLTTIDKELM